MFPKKIELLAPAGSYEGIIAAACAGADAIYVGGTKYGARAYAKNLTQEELIEAIHFLHLHNKKLFLTINTLFKNNEMDDLYDFLIDLYKEGLDAVIVQDLGLVPYIKEQFPELAIHISTQASVMNSYGVKYFEEHKADRVVLARELSLKEIKNICNSTSLEIECFIHGALCYCYSGQCLMSSFLGGRSGNRGRCAQPCRLPYDVYKNEKKLNKKEQNYVLSPRDICLLEYIPDMIEAGVYSLKIEGRMKRPEYTAGVVSVYRKYIDLYLQNGKKGYSVSKKDLTYLENLYSRSGFSNGYLYEYNGPDMMTLYKPDYITADEKMFEKIRNNYMNYNRKLPIKGYARIKQGEPISLTITYNEMEVCVNGPLTEPALNQPTTIDKIEKQLKKTGNTPFEFEELIVEMDTDIFVPIQTLNQIRRDAITKLEADLYQKRTDINKIERNNLKQFERHNADSILINISVQSLSQLYIAAKYDQISDIYISYELFYSLKEELLYPIIEKLHNQGKKLFFSFPQIFREKESNLFQNIEDILLKYHITGVLVKTADSLYFMLNKNYNGEIRSDYTFYTLNHSAKDFISKYITIDTVSLELNEKELKQRINAQSEIIVYGYIPFMVSAQCLEKNLKGCSKDGTSFILKDRYKKEMTVKKDCLNCVNYIYNSEPLMLLDYDKKISGLNFYSVRLNFTKENEGETRHIIDLCIQNFVYHKQLKYDFTSFTRGHFNRGIE